MWVWIPRYAYKIDWKEDEETGKIDIMFLQGTTNLNKEGEDVTKLGYKVHPAFTDGKNNNYNNGEWDKEITGIWVSKFEAGYAGQTYPVFMGKTYSYNNIQIGEMYELSRNLNQDGNPYGFNRTVDSHMMKNSEWGAVSYLAHSKYGRNGAKITINNLDVSKVENNAITVTGYAGNQTNAIVNKIEKIEEKLEDNYNDKSYAWYTKEGELASTTANQYGVYDMNGGASEYVAAYMQNIDEETGNLYGKALLENKTSTKYCTIYKAGKTDTYGDAISETSRDTSGFTSWFGETSIYPSDKSGFFLRSGEHNRVKFSGIFDYIDHSGHSFGSYGFRCVLINN